MYSAPTYRCKVVETRLTTTQPLVAAMQKIADWLKNLGMPSTLSALPITILNF